MPYGKFKMGKDEKKKPPFAKDPGRKTIMPVPKKPSDRKIGQPVPPKKVR